jgi:hypothetical protein
MTLRHWLYLWTAAGFVVGTTGFCLERRASLAEVADLVKSYLRHWVGL